MQQAHVLDNQTRLLMPCHPAQPRWLPGKSRAVVLLVLLLASLSDVVLATNDFIEGKEEGWFWYEDPIIPEEPLPPVPVPPEAPPPAKPPAKQPPGPPVFSVKWLQEQLPKLREKAIDNPTRENVQIYMYAQRVMMDKADRFSNMFKRVALTDPLLDENNRFPFATAFKSVTLRANEWAQKKILKSLSKKAGIFFFYSSSCKYCHFQIFPLKQFALRYGFEIRLISLDGKAMPGMEKMPFIKDAGWAKSWNITVVPAIVLAAPPDRIGVVSQGLLSTTALVSRMLLTAEEMHLLGDDELKLAHLDERGLLTTDDMSFPDVPDGVDPNDPKSWMAYLKDRLEISMGQDDPRYSILPPPTPQSEAPRLKYKKLNEKRLEILKKGQEPTPSLLNP